MNDSKQLKDPIYGYISIPVEIMTGIVDTAVFQRLRHITQTSYSPLFASAVHNRFVHSLGVYHLGKIAVHNIKQRVQGLIEQGKLTGYGIDINHLEQIFLLACLLHDVGHAPFSHTGESFYLEDRTEYAQLHELLKETVGSESFNEDIPTIKSNSAAPHEIMSAIVGIREFSDFLPSIGDRELFARCITGYGYKQNTGLDGILNCFINLLNSKIIDVDKLDYLIRDAYITGFYTVQIDYERLLNAITIVEEKATIDEGQRNEITYSLAYHKGAISVVENVVYAHDSERKWIQNHPVILYETYILQHMMELLSEKLDSKEQRLFSVESLGVKGQEFENNTIIRLFSDDDIISISKRYYHDSEFISEYFNRGIRRRPLWKSEAEYKTLFLDQVQGGQLLDALERAMEITEKYLSKSSTNWVINKELVSIIESELEELESKKLDPVSKSTQKREKQDILKVVKCLTTYAASAGYDGDFVLLSCAQFNSSFAKTDFSAIKIVFPSPSGEEIIGFKEKISSVLGITSERRKAFYIYYKREKQKSPALDVRQLRKELFKTFIE